MTEKDILKSVEETFTVLGLESWIDGKEVFMKKLAKELKLLFDENERKYYCLTKKDIMTVYFKCKDKTGHTFTSHLSDAMRFNSRNEAIEYNKKWLYGDCEVVEC